MHERRQIGVPEQVGEGVASDILGDALLYRVEGLLLLNRPVGEYLT